ncbi:MAG: hypothetical protein Q8J84_10535 [Flavobacteriaceae bacterium]|nr:hypothetical protein [Flavobacteriaceae bacterium]
MKSIVYSVVNEALYNSKISEVDVSGLRPTTKSFNGQISLKTISNEIINFNGDFDVFDFLKEYGFVIHTKLFLKS